MRRTICAALLALIGCGESTAPPRACEGAIDVFMIRSPVRFDWEPSCGISELSVTAVAENPLEERVVWGWTVPETRPVGPDVVYGASPEGSSVWMEAEPLHVGAEYRVTVMYTVGGDVVVASGTRTFRWFLPD